MNTNAHFTMKYTFRGVEYADKAALIAAIIAAKATLAETDFRGASQQRFIDAQRNIAGAGGTLVDLDDADIETIVDDAADFEAVIVTQPAARTYTDKANPAKLSLTDARLTGCRETGRMSATSTPSKEYLVTFQTFDKQEVSGSTFGTYLTLVGKSGAVQLDKGIPVIGQIVKIRIEQRQDGVTTWESNDPADVAAAKAQGVATHTNRAGKESVYVLHTSSTPTYRSFGEGKADEAYFLARESAYAKRVERIAAAEADAVCIETTAQAKGTEAKAIAIGNAHGAVEEKKLTAQLNLALIDTAKELVADGICASLADALSILKA